jgi:hypothetical protein
MTLHVTGSDLAPLAAGAVVLNVTAMGATARGSLTVYPAGITRPNTTNLSWGPRDAVSNLVTVKVGSAGRVALWNKAGSVDVVTDLVGYYAPPLDSTGAGRYFSIPPFRLVDTRASSPIGPGLSEPVRVAGTAVPAGAVAVLLTVAALNTSAPSYLAVVPGDLTCSAAGSGPCVSTWNVRWEPGAPAINKVITPLGKGPDGSPGWIALFNRAGSADVLVDVDGWYGDSTLPNTMGSTFTPIDPCRAADSTPIPIAIYWAETVVKLDPRVDVSGGSRLDGQGGSGQPIPGHSCTIPTWSTAVVVTATAGGGSSGRGDLFIRPTAPGCASTNHPRAWLNNPADLSWRGGQDVSIMDQVRLTHGSVVVMSSSEVDPSAAPAPNLPLTLDLAGYFSSAVPVRLLCIGGASAGGSAPPIAPGATRVVAIVWDPVTQNPVDGEPVSFSVTPMPGSAECSQTSLSGGRSLTNDSIAWVDFHPHVPSICLITAAGRGEVATTVSVDFGMLSLTPGLLGSTIFVIATYLRSDGKPHPGASLDFNVMQNTYHGGPLTHGSCITDGSGHCTFSFGRIPRDGIFPATLVTATDAVGVSATVAAG